jgi:alcohol dehydrogenase
MGPANRITVKQLRANKSKSLGKYAAVGKLFSDEKTRSDEYFTDLLLDTIDSLTEEMKIPSLARFGISPPHFEKVVSKTENKNNPIALGKDSMAEILKISL